MYIIPCNTSDGKWDAITKYVDFLYYTYMYQSNDKGMVLERHGKTNTQFTHCDVTAASQRRTTHLLD